MSKLVIFIDDFSWMGNNAGNNTDIGIKNIIKKLQETAAEPDQIKFKIITPESNKNKELNGMTLEDRFGSDVMSYVNYDVDNANVENTAVTINNIINGIIGENGNELNSVSLLIDVMLRKCEAVEDIRNAGIELLSAAIYNRLQVAGFMGNDSHKVFLYTARYKAELVTYVQQEINGDEYIPVYYRRSFDGTLGYNQNLYRRILQM